MTHEPDLTERQEQVLYRRPPRNRLGRRGGRPMTDEPDLTERQEQVLRALMAREAGGGYRSDRGGRSRG